MKLINYTSFPDKLITEIIEAGCYATGAKLGDIPVKVVRKKPGNGAHGHVSWKWEDPGAVQKKIGKITGVHIAVADKSARWGTQESALMNTAQILMKVILHEIVHVADLQGVKMAGPKGHSAVDGTRKYTAHDDRPEEVRAEVGAWNALWGFPELFEPLQQRMAGRLLVNAEMAKVRR